MFNDIFFAYAKHEQEKEDIIQTILAAAYRGETEFSIDLDDNFSDDEIEEIKREVIRRWREK